MTPFGDAALLVEVDDVAAAHRLADGLEGERGGGPAALGESVVGFGNVVVLLEPGRERPEVVEGWLRDLARRIPDRSGDAAAGDQGRRVVIPAAFEGPDLGEVAAGLGTTPHAVVEALTGAALEVAFVGFSPGFPYLVGLPPTLASVPRRATPRPSVPAGSVAVGGGFASVYPQSTPGGWMLLGRTSLRLFDPHRPPYSLLRAGDAVRFTVEGRAPDGPTGTRRPPLVNRGDRFAEILRPGVLSLIQDRGRRSVAGQGVPRAGPADPEAMGLANRLAGNPDGAAAVEVTAAGPSLRFTGGAHVTVVGVGPEAVEVLVDGRPVGSGAVVPVVDGQVVSVGRVRDGLRAYLAVAGGFDTPLEVGSRASDLLCGLGPGPLRAGDRLGLGPPSRPLGLLSPPRVPFGSGRRPVLRVIPGPHLVPSDRWSRLLSRPWTVGAASNRVGLRLEADGDRSTAARGEPATDRGAAIPSTGMVTGAVQIPPDGNPIVLMPDHATVGGYPVACCVISADLPILGQLRPGDTVDFAPVDRREALDARDRWERSMAERVSGWFPTAVGT
ncbi:MAG TPA: carboxyltransferase domain-containing protein [Acidimicrobiales bacterium]